MRTSRHDVTRAHLYCYDAEASVDCARAAATSGDLTHRGSAPAAAGGGGGVPPPREHHGRRAVPDVTGTSDQAP